MASTIDVSDAEANNVQQSLLSSFHEEADFQGNRLVENESDLEPSFGDEEKRQMTPRAAQFTLLASMLGGGMLTLPYATATVGIGTSLIISFLSAVASEVTYRFVIEAARATKRSSYQAIGEEILGKPGKIVSMLSLIFLTLFASMGYLLLLGLLVAEVFTNANESPSRLNRNVVSIIFAAILAPLSSSKSLNALRYSNALSVASALLLLLSLAIESSKSGEGFHPEKRWRPDEEILWFTTSIDDIIYAVPFYIGAYMAHFSLLSVHSELVRPTRQRVSGVLRGTVSFAWVLYSAIGVLGYMYSLDRTCDSILSNLPRDWLTTLGRLGLVATLAFSYPLFIVPCRATICDLIIQQYDGRHETEEDKTQFNEWLQSDWVRRVLTGLIVACSATLSCVVPSAALFVSLTGSSVGTMLSLILPSLFYMRLTRDRRSKCFTFFAGVLFILGLFILTLCSYASILHASDDVCNLEK